jgi:hypothetical protein
VDLTARNERTYPQEGLMVKGSLQWRWSGISGDLGSHLIEVAKGIPSKQADLCIACQFSLLTVLRRSFAERPPYGNAQISYFRQKPQRLLH